MTTTMKKSQNIFNWSRLPNEIKRYIFKYVKILYTIPPIIEINQNKYRMVVCELGERFNKLVYPVSTGYNTENNTENNNALTFREEMEKWNVDMDGLFDFHKIVYRKKVP